ncbi:MAG: hypothetical protein SFV18_07120 [Bryobacteraceae bacterium]|nr:hypothetical protein [Bryobacteraceae bacterium]
MSGTAETRIEAIEKLGYTRQEAAFLATIALHSGYFMRRQFCRLAGIASGKRATRFVAKLLDRGHARRHRFALHRSVIHLGYRPFYEAIGEPESRNRREHQPTSIEARLMAIDYVLSHFDSRFLETRLDRDRMLQERGVAHEDLRFAHRFPIRMVGDDPVFTFIDSGFETESAFVTFLRSHARIFEALAAFQLDFVGTRDTDFPRSQRVFERTLSGGNAPGLDAEKLNRLLYHFADRQAFESRRMDGFNRARIDRLRDELHEFAAPVYQTLFAEWKAGGSPAVTRVIGERKPLRGTFRPVELPFTYGLLWQRKGDG